MSLQASYFKKVFHFNFKARTSRGLMKDHDAWFVKVWHEADPSVFGIGECGPLPGLSIDANTDLENVLAEVVSKISSLSNPDITQLNRIIPEDYPSIMFACETAFLDLANGGKRIIYKNSFVEGKPIPINGLIWMGDMDFTMSQINIKIYDGFRCIKLKVGGLDFDRECDILEYIRKRYFRENIVIRLDANGAFKHDVLFKLGELAKFNVHSIEQPIKAGLPEMEELCRKSPIPVAFDEELIGKLKAADKIKVLDSLKPQFIILKPMLHGGLQHCAEWIKLAESRGIGWWITSALESNIGLNAICQFTANNDVEIPQGLGTGAIYSDNFTSPLQVDKGKISIDLKSRWNEEEFTETSQLGLIQ
jgi:o-succinylbenzoate synthase